LGELNKRHVGREGFAQSLTCQPTTLFDV